MTTMLLYWIWFSLLRLSPRQKMALLEHYYDPEDLYHAKENPKAEFPEWEVDRDLTPANRVLEECNRKGIGVLAFSDVCYPPRLRNIPDPPFVLYYKGTLPQWQRQPVIGIVGTRKASGYGVTTAKRLGAQIAACGALVVSGGASGVDTAAMAGCMSQAATVVGVLGCGVDIVYPKSNEALFEKVIRHGCLLSEYVPGTKPAPWQFPQRNRIISGMANGVLVVEAPIKSGALITARDALEQGRDVYAVPGNVDVETCAGSNALLQEGAMAVITGWDVVKQYASNYPGRVSNRQEQPDLTRIDLPEEANSVLPGREFDKNTIDKGEKSPYSGLENKTPVLDPEEQAVVAQLKTVPENVDAVIARLDMDARKVMGILTRLTLKGVVKSHPGKRISK